jgi:TfoX/Sxy family transcriptional regulator of competence genes
MPVDAALREQVDADIMSRGEVTPRNMMGTTAYMVRNRMFAFWVADGLVAKVPDHTRQDLLDRKRGVLFQGPQGRGFGDWTRLQLENEDDVPHVLEAVKEAYEYIRGAAATQQKSKRKARKS